MDMLVELTEFDRSHRLGSLTTSSMMETSAALTFAIDGDSTLMTWTGKYAPRDGFGGSVRWWGR
jgi:hypothetical protein